MFALGTGRPIGRGQHRKVLAIGHVGRHRGVAGELLLQTVHGESERFFKRRRCLNVRLKLCGYLFTTVRSRADKVALPRLLIFRHQRHVVKVLHWGF